VLALRESGYVSAGRVLGFSRRRLLFRHILPNVSGILAVQTSLALAWSVLAEASLSFLGLGPPPPTASLGEMVSQAGSLAATAWWTLAFPSVAIIVAVIGFNLLGDGLRDAIDPRTRNDDARAMPISDRGPAMRVIGMISGTSFDAVEAVLADFLQEDEVLECDLVTHRSVPYPDRLRDRIAAVLPPASTNIGEVCELDVAIGQFFGEVAYDLAKQVGESPCSSFAPTARPSFTGWRATARGHAPVGSACLDRRGDRATVVSDVRNRDIAAGGHGHRSRACSTSSCSAHQSGLSAAR